MMRTDNRSPLFFGTLCTVLGLFLLPLSGQAQGASPSAPSTVSLKISLSGTFPGTAVIVPPRENSGNDGAEPIHYPSSASDEWVEGTVKLKMLIGADGRIKESQVLDNGGDERLLRASVEGLRKAGFTPGSIDEKPTEMWVTVEVAFAIGGREAGKLAEPPQIAMPTEMDFGPPTFAPATTAAPKLNSQASVPDIDAFLPDVIEASYDRDELTKFLEYPPSAKENGLEGKVVVSALIDTEGTVLNVVIRSSSNKLFEIAAKRAVSKLDFSPAIQNGKPIKMWKTFTIFFALNDPPPDSLNVKEGGKDDEGYVPPPSLLSPDPSHIGDVGTFVRKFPRTDDTLCKHPIHSRLQLVLCDSVSLGLRQTPIGFRQIYPPGELISAENCDGERSS